MLEKKMSMIQKIINEREKVKKSEFVNKEEIVFVKYKLQNGTKEDIWL